MPVAEETARETASATRGARDSGPGLSRATAAGHEWPPAQLPEFAVEAELLGDDEVWVVEDCFFAGGLALAAIALGATSRIRVGVALLPTAVRNPAIAAMEIATLANVHPGRLEVTVGHGAESSMRQIRARPRNRVVVLEETVSVVAALLAGRTVPITGELASLTDVVLDHPRRHRRAGSSGRPATKGGRSPDATPTESSCLRAPRRRLCVGSPHRDRRNSAATTAVYAWVWIDDDPAAARAALRPELASGLAKGRYPELARRAAATTAWAGKDSNLRLRIMSAGFAGVLALRSESSAGLGAVIRLELPSWEHVGNTEGDRRSLTSAYADAA